MAKLVSIFLSARQQNLFAAGVWLAAFVLLSGLFAALGVERLHSRVHGEAERALAEFATTRTGVLHALNALEHQAAGLVCGEAMQVELRRVAFIPDGLNEFFFAPGRVARCSTNTPVFSQPHAFGTPDAGADGRLPFEVWFAADLDFAGYPRMAGAIVRRGDFAVVVRPKTTHAPLPDWLALEGVLVGDGGRVWPLSGDGGVYAAAEAAAGPALLPLDLRREVICDAEGFHCIGTRADFLAGLAADRLQLAGLAGLAAALSTCFAAFARRALARHFTFEARFLRHLDAETLVCAYQPILEIETGRIVGCEVLARWRDLDDSLVFPDRFIPLVERHGLTLPFTRLVVEKAHAELSRHVPADRPLQVNVNIFPADIGRPELAEVFAPFLAEPGRFAPVAEIVETDALDLGAAQEQVERLRRHGVRVYIDDFGSGYSSIHTLAALAVDGVKLDRSFAMAQEGGIMARMLGHAVEMVHAAGRAIVVEGVETAERLASLKAMPARIDYAQGYHVARPLTVEAFAALPAAMEVEAPFAKAA